MIDYPRFREQPRPWQDPQMKLTSLEFPLVCDQRSSSELDNSHHFSTPSWLLHYCVRSVTSKILPTGRYSVYEASNERVSRPGLYVDLDNWGTVDR